MVHIRDALYIQIDRFTLKSGKAKELANTYQEHLSEWISKCSGFVSCNLHVSEDGSHLINYAQWRDKESFQAFSENSRQKALKNAIEKINPDNVQSDHFELVTQQSIEDEFWSKPRF